MATPLLPGPVRRLAAWCAVVLLAAGVLALVVWLCVVLKTVVTPVLLAVLGTALLGPLHRRLIRMGVHRSLAAALTCLALTAVVGGAAYVVVLALVETGDQIVDALRRAGQALAEHFGAVGTSVEDLAKNSEGLLAKFGGTAASGLIAGLSVVGTTIAMAVLALVLIFFFLRDSDRAADTLRSLVPSRSGDLMEAMGRRAFEAVEGFMRGTTLVALVDAVLIGVGLLVLRVPGAVGLAALVFVTAYIPYLGAFLSGAVAVLVALADRGWVIALWVLGVVLAVQMIEGYVLQPLVQSRTVQMHPALVMLAITAGASVAGILGMLLAVPLTAAAFGIVSELRTLFPERDPQAPLP
ncbi:AI-2E family transporter [Streptomyces lavendulae]|uniref:AI-2 transport protein TqsA n=1 Tax=Streptomyces lavendulae subsp. lavendulae TaxID=58340 RepID=A0A2K8PGA2_STRLA|nr:AI-2E family transporter [Streptomyces lavendulae]ATZ25776.1 AI-2 transport protein TqsA [Streptomyces lavendulae subsp. lavendulae]QUQ55605.1 Putative transport protein [Streptomyces lavendulae subsp. lavendulae]